VLLLSTTTGYQLRSFDDCAERLGIDLVLATDRCHQLDDPWRDRAIPVRFHDEGASLHPILRAAESRPFDGVLAVGDRPATLAARVAEALSIPGNLPAAADATRNKRVMRERFAAAGLVTPWFVELAEDERTPSQSSIRYPAVVKPLGLSGSRGVIRVNTPEELQQAISRVRGLLARPSVRAQRSGVDHQLLLEGYIDGREYAVEGVVTGGTLRVLAVFDKPDPLDGPFFEETIYVTPSAAPSEVLHDIAATTQRAITALGLVHGPVHAECRAGSQGVVMLEVAARPIGGLCSKVLRFRDCDRIVPLEEFLLRHACGMDVSGLAPVEQAAGVMMIPIMTRGVYKGVAGEEAARAVPEIEGVEITAKLDQLVEPLPEGDSYLGFIFARGATPDQVVSSLHAAHAHLEFHMTRELPVLSHA
jgi:hypothetical protein